MKLESKIDKSVNFVTPCHDGGFFESRYVRREEEVVCCYLSSHSGCNLGCNMCHLTASKQTMMYPADLNNYLEQAKQVVSHYLMDVDDPPAREIHFNFMARGEPMHNMEIRKHSFELFRKLHEMSDWLIPSFNVSTIMPKGWKTPLEETFMAIQPTIYYSLYSLRQSFRDKWLPNAMEPLKAIQILRNYQAVTKKIIKLHWCFIHDENDEFSQIKEICDAVSDLKVEFNIVRYNPYSSEYGKETNEEWVYRLGDTLRSLSRSKVEVVSRVGLDVFASCGTFVEGVI